MKKTIKAPKKTNSQSKRRRRRRRSPTKSRKTGYSEVIKAFMLVGVLIAVSAVISFAVINFRSAGVNPPEVVEVEVEVEPAAVISETPVISVSVQLSTSQNNSGNTRATVPPAPVKQPETVPVRPEPPSVSSANTSVATTSNSSMQKPAENLGTLVFVIDDAGNNLRELEPFLNIPGNITIAVLPGLPYSAEAARRIRAAGKEVILHQPMEAINGQDPGPGAIYSGMSASEIRAILSRNIAEIGPVVGMNNHQGSKITMNMEMMETVLAFCKENALLFLDSRTTAETKAPLAARQLGIKIAERDVFLDNEQDRESMLRFLNTGLARAQRNGLAIMIGHTWSPQLAPLLTEQVMSLTIQGYRISTISDILK